MASRDIPADAGPVRAAGSARPRVCIVGPLVGRQTGRATPQPQILAELLASAGYSIIAASDRPGRFARPADIAATLIRRRGDYDLVVLGVFSGPSFAIADAASLIATRLRKPVVMFLHGGMLPEYTARHPRWSRRVFDRAAAIVAPTAFLARVARRFGYHPEIVPNVLELGDYPFRMRSTLKPRLLWMRAFIPYANPAMAVRAFAEVRRIWPDATLVMAGQDRGLEEETKSLARRIGVADAVTFPGFLDSPAKARFGDAADLYLSTVRIDNMPVSVLEACAMGLPIVATEVGGVPDLLTHESSGLLVPDDDHAAMAAAVERLLRDPELAARLSAGARRIAIDCSWDAVKPKWERLLADVAERPDGRRIRHAPARTG